MKNLSTFALKRKRNYEIISYMQGMDEIIHESIDDDFKVFVSKLPVDFSLQKLKFALSGCIKIGKQEEYQDDERSKFLVVEAFLKTGEAANKSIELKILRLRHNTVIDLDISKYLPEIVVQYRKKTRFKGQNKHELQTVVLEEHPPTLYIAEIPETYSEHKLKMVVKHAMKSQEVVLKNLQKYIVGGENGEDETFQFVEIVTNSFESANSLVENSTIKQRHAGKVFDLKILEEIPKQVLDYWAKVAISETALGTERDTSNGIGDTLKKAEVKHPAIPDDVVKSNLETKPPSNTEPTKCEIHDFLEKDEKEQFATTKLSSNQPTKCETKIGRAEAAHDGTGDNVPNGDFVVDRKQSSEKAQNSTSKKEKPLPRPRLMNKKDIICNALPKNLIKENKLHRHFEKFGRIVNLKIDQSRKCAWVSFADHASARRAIAIDYLDDDDDYVKLNLRWDTDTDAEYKKATERKSQKSEKPQETHLMGVHERIHSLQRGLFCRNIPYQYFNKSELSRHFQRFGSIETVDCVERRNNSFAKIYFKDHESATQALVRGSQMRDGRKIVLEWDNREFENLRKDLLWNEVRPTPTHFMNKGTTDSILTPKTATQPITWFNLLKENEKLFANFADNCIIVPKTSQTQSLDDLKNYFQSYADSCGGAVIDIRLILDGYLVIFEDENVVEGIVEKEDHQLNGTTFLLLKKVIPKVFKDRFVAEVEAEAHTLLMFFECCDQKRQSAPSHIQEMGNSKYSLIQYDRDDYDLKNIMRIARRDELDGKKLKVFQLCHTDCIKVENIPEGVTQDTIKLTFRSKKNANGGDVTLVVYQKEENNALVYFADYKIAQRVANNPIPLKLKGKKVSVSLYYPDFNDDFPIIAGENTKPKRSILPFQYNPTCEQDIIHFVFGITELKESLVKNLEGVAEFNVVNKSTGNKGKTFQYVIKITPFQPKKLLGQKYTQDRFELECKEILCNYFDQFVVTVVDLNKERMTEMRSERLWRKDDEFIKVNVDQKIIHDVFVRWNHQKQGSVTITGKKLEVHAIKIFFKLHCDIQNDKRNYLENKFRKLVECGIFAEIKLKFGDEIELKIDLGNCQATVKGAKNRVSSFDKEIDKQIEELSLFKLNIMETEQIEYLKNILKGRKSDESFLKNFQENLKKSNILASLQLVSGMPKFFASEYTVACKAETVLATMVLKETIDIGTNFHQLVQMPEWKKLQQQICSTGFTQVLLDKKNSTVLIVGQELYAKKDLETIRSHFEKHNILEREISMHFTAALYIREYCLEPDCCLNEIDWEISQMAQGIKLKGMALKVEKGLYLEKVYMKIAKPEINNLAEKWIKKQIEGLGVASYEIKEPGMPKYFLGSKGKSFLDLQRKINSCIILVHSDKYQDWQPTRKNEVKFPKAMPKKPRGNNRVILSVNVSGITLRVINGDISLHQCDAIVNASNTDLQLRSAGVSGSILKNGGPGIQNAMDKWTLKNGKLEEGKAVSTSAGILPCNVIVHAVGPIWGQDRKASKCSYLLKGCVMESLAEAEKNNCHSIAIPAISCGVFGGKASACIKIIVSSVCEYFIGENSCISQVDFIEYSTTNGHLKIFENEVRENQPSSSIPVPSSNHPNNNKETGIIDKLKNYLLPHSSRHAENFQNISTSVDCNVNIITGDITNETSDVIVTSTSPQNFHNAQGSAISKALAVKAGGQLVMKCRKLATVSNLSAGEVIKTSGYNLKCQKIYHVLLNNYTGSGSLNILSRAIQTCLKMAENSKYSSISFPCLGSGGFNYPINEVAKTTKQIVENYPTTHLKTANIVIFPANASSVQFGKLNSTSSPAVNITANSGIVGSLNVNVQQGDITTENADVILNVTSDNFNIAQGGGVSSAIAAKAGNAVVSECLNNPQSQTMYYRVTSGGQMSCRHIIHMVTSNDVNSIAGVLEEVFAVADSLNAKTIAMPAVGTGQLGLDNLMVAQTIGKAINKFANCNPVNVNNIKIVVFQPQMLQAFKNGVLGEINMQKIVKSNAAYFPEVNENADFGKIYKCTPLSKVGQNPNAEKTQLYLCCKDKDSLSDTWTEVSKHVNDMSIKKTIENKILKQLGVEEEMEISALQVEFDVTIQRDDRGQNHKLVISGLMQNVSDVSNKIQMIIHTLKEAINRTNYVSWKYKDSHGKFNNFSPKINLQLEESYKKNAKTGVVISIFVQDHWEKYCFDFTANTETCMKTGLVNGIKRTTPNDDNKDLPPIWEDMGNNSFKQVQVQSSSQEYTSVIQKFQATGLPLKKVISLERIQNPTLYHQYWAQKKKIESRGGSQPASRELYHGTCENACSNVSRDNFDRGYAGKHATAYGKGVYFATTAQYSHGYAQANPSGQHFMFLADVVTGEFCQGNSSFSVAPLNTVTQRSFDSVVNCVNNPTMFVVFKDASVYPKYLLKYC